MKIYFEEVFPDYVHSYGNVISIPIIDTKETNLMIDKERSSKGKIPFFNEDELGRIDMEAWYEIRLIVDRETLEPQEIEAWVAEGSCEEKDGETCHFDLDDKEDIKRQLLEQLELFDMTADELKEVDD